MNSGPGRSSLLFDLSPESLIVYDPKGVVRRWNRASERLYGWPSTTTMGHCLDALGHGDWLPLDRVLAADRWDGEICRRTIEGIDVMVQVAVSVRRDAQGQPVEIVEFGRRAPAVSTEHPAISDPALMPPSAGRFEQLLDHMPIALWEIDARAAGQNFERLHKEGVTDLAAFLDDHPEIVDFTCDTVLISKVNRAATQLFGATTPEQLLGPIRYLYTETPSTANRIMCAHWNGQRHHVEEMKVRTCDGRVIDVLFLVTFLKLDEDVATTFLMLVDISDRVKAEAELAALRDDFAHVDRISTLGELVSSIGHELEQPLGAAERHARAILEALDAGITQPMLIRPLVEQVMAQALVANDMISRIRAMSVKHQPESRSVGLDAVCRSSMMVVEQICREKGIILLHRPATDGLHVSGDPVQLQQVVVNILLNAIHAVEDQRSGRKEIVIVTGCIDHDVFVEISDSGPGIQDQDFERIFTSFVSTRAGAIGMGLSICRTIVEAHAGSIAVENRREGGALVRICLPRQPDMDGGATTSTRAAA